MQLVKCKILRLKEARVFVFAVTEVLGGQNPAWGVWCLVLAESLGEFRITQVRASVSRKMKALLGVLPGSPISWL